MAGTGPRRMFAVCQRINQNPANYLADFAPILPDENGNHNGTKNPSASANCFCLASKVRNCTAPKCSAVATCSTSNPRYPPVQVYCAERRSAMLATSAQSTGATPESPRQYWIEVWQVLSGPLAVEMSRPSAVSLAKGRPRFTICTVSPFSIHAGTRLKLFPRSATVAVFMIQKKYHGDVSWQVSPRRLTLSLLTAGELSANSEKRRRDATTAKSS